MIWSTHAQHQKKLCSVKELDRVLAKGSFQIKEWLCTSEVVQNQLAEVTIMNLDTEHKTPQAPSQVKVTATDKVSRP